MPWLTFLAGRAEISTAMMKFAPIFFAALTGTGCDRPPSTYLRLPITTGWNTFGIDAEARTACPALPTVEHHRFAAFKIGRNSGKFDGELLHRTVADFVVDVVLQLLSFDEAAGGQGQIHQIGFTQNFCFQFEAVGRHSRSVHTADNRAGGCAVTILIGILFSFKTLIIPIWAKPLDAPPPKASATVLSVWVQDMKPYFDPA